MTQNITDHRPRGPVAALEAELARPEPLAPRESEIERALRLSRDDTPVHKPWVSNAEPGPSAGETAVFDPDATVVIGRHRSDGTRDYRTLSGAPEAEPQRTARGGWRGWVRVPRLWRRGRAEAGA